MRTLPNPSPVAEVRTMYAFVERNFRLAKRYLSWEVVHIFYSIINAMTIGLIGFTSPAKD